MPNDQPTADEVRELLEVTKRAPKFGVIIREKIVPASMIAALCNHYLAQAAAPQMTAGEFAGLVVGRLQQVINDYRNSGNDFGEWYVNYARARVLTIAREHNIEIVEPSKP